MTFSTSDFDYSLPEELIAQNPPEHRTDSRMMVLDAVSGRCEILPFPAIKDFLRKGDCLAVNDTKVIRARLFAGKATGAKIEIMLLHPAGEQGAWVCYMKPAKRAPEGTVLELFLTDGAPSGYSVTVAAKDTATGECTVRLEGAPAEKILALCGHVPLPPYIKRGNLPPDSERYQTVYANHPGAVAAPTAGLHFTKELLAEIRGMGVHETALTLHVGAGTFKPVTVEKITEHKMHSEEFVFSEENASMLNSTRASGGRIAAVGTTTLRVLETCVNPDGTFTPRSGATDIFIYPPYNILSADILLTNFHLPKSTLLMLVSAFAGYDNIMNAYRTAVKERMRFFSYGDCMLILRKGI